MTKPLNHSLRSPLSQILAQWLVPIRRESNVLKFDSSTRSLSTSLMECIVSWMVDMATPSFLSEPGYIKMKKLILVKYNEMLDMRRSWEEIIALMVSNAVFLGKFGNVAGLGDRVATEVNNPLGGRVEQMIEDIFV